MNPQGKHPRERAEADRKDQYQRPDDVRDSSEKVQGGLGAQVEACADGANRRTAPFHLEERPGKHQVADGLDPPGLS